MDITDQQQPHSYTTNSENPNFTQFNPNHNQNQYEPHAHSVCPFRMDSSAKKKRGRPRKYSSDSTNNTFLQTPPNSNSGPIVLVPVNNNTNKNDGGGFGGSGGSSKRGRGRPPSSGKKQLDALGGAAGIGFTPHVILIKAGEDICSKILAFAQEGPRTICLLSANGAISNANICHSPLSGGTVSYEGRYEIISLRGSFTPESSAGRSRSSSLSVTLAGSDGQVLGGSLSGMLIAASPVQIIVGSFIEDVKKLKSVSSSSPVPNMLDFGAPVAAASPPSQGPSSGSSNENGGSPYDGGSGPYTNANQQPYTNANQQPHHSMPVYHSEWAAEP